MGEKRVSMVKECYIIHYTVCVCVYIYVHYTTLHYTTHTHTHYTVYMGFPGGSNGKESACNMGNLGSIPGSGRSPGEGNDSPLQYSSLGNPMDRGAWQATVHAVAKSQIRLSD